VSAAEVWDNQARTLEDARRAVWAEPDWKKGQALALAHLTDMPQSGEVVDVGAGVGRLTIPIALQRPEARLWAVDVSKKMLGHLRQIARRAGADNIQTRRTDGERLPEALPEQVDGVWSVLTFQHIPPGGQHRYLMEMADRLVTGGPLVVQYVEGGEGDRGPLSHPVDSLQMWEWLDEAGLDGTIEPGPHAFPTWRWIHAVKR